MRASAIRACESHFDLAMDSASMAYVAASAAAGMAHADPTMSYQYSTRQQADKCPRNISQSKGSAIDDDNPLAAGKNGTVMINDGERRLRRGKLVARGAAFRAGCLVAAQGLMDPATGPRQAGASLAKSLFSLRPSSPSSEEGSETPTRDETETETDRKGEKLASGCRKPGERGSKGNASVIEGIPLEREQ